MNNENIPNHVKEKQDMIPPQVSIDETNHTSRFSRRKFLQTGIASSPLLLTVKSPVAWGTGTSWGGDRCSLTTLMSGNASHPHNCQSPPRDCGYWYKVLTCGSDDPLNGIRKRLKNCPQRISGKVKFNHCFLNHFQNWQKSSALSGCTYRLSPTDSDNPSFEDILGQRSQQFKCVLEFKKDNSSILTIDLTEKIKDLHEVTLTGYINSIFNPDFISYGYFPDQIMNSFNTMISGCETLIMKSYRRRQNRQKSIYNYDGVSYSKSYNRMRISQISTPPEETQNTELDSNHDQVINEFCNRLKSW